MSKSVTLPTQKPNAAPIGNTAYFKDLSQLFVIGLLTQLIYIIYIVAFPLISNTQKGGPAADLESLMSDYHWFAPIYTVGILLLYFLFWRAMLIVSRFTFDTARKTQQAGCPNPNTIKLFILAFGLLFGFTLVWLYPITANDLFRYVLRGRVWAIYNQSPMLVPPNNFPQDPFAAFAGEFGEWVSGYGPLWEIVVQLPLRLGATDMVPGSISLKFVVLFSYLACAILLGWFARPYVRSTFKFTSTSVLPSDSASLTALTFFAWNPLILIQGAGNGHNDMLFMALMVLGIVLWQRKLWWAVALALSLATLAKITVLLMLPFFFIVLYKSEPAWGRRLLKTTAATLIILATGYLIYRVLGPLSLVFQDVWNALTDRLAVVLNSSETLHYLWFTLGGLLGFAPPGSAAPPGLGSMLTARRGFAIASGVRMLLREIIPPDVAEPLPRNTASYIFILFYLWLLLELWRGKLNLVTAGFLAYFSQLMLGATFRIWYPMWLIPLAALSLTPATFWSTFLLSLTSELSIINYFVVWRWYLADWNWGKTGPLSKYWNYWTIMHLLTVPWLFAIPLFGPILMKWRQRRNSANTLSPNRTQG